MLKLLKSLLKRKNPRSIIADELGMAEVYLISAELNKEALVAEVNKQEATCEMYRRRIARLSGELQAMSNLD